MILIVLCCDLGQWKLVMYMISGVSDLNASQILITSLFLKVRHMNTLLNTTDRACIKNFYTICNCCLVSYNLHLDCSESI